MKFHGECDGNLGDPKPSLYVESIYQPVTLSKSSSLAGVYEIHTVVPAGLNGEVAPETVMENGGPVRSDQVNGELTNNDAIPEHTPMRLLPLFVLLLAAPVLQWVGTLPSMNSAQCH